MAKSVTLDCPKTTSRSGSTTQLSVNATFDDGSTQDVTNESRWFVSNRLVATVAEDGTVTALRSGVTNIRATYKTVAGLCEFQVDDTPPPPPPPTSAGIVINEFRTRGPGGHYDEFIELRNDATVPIDISAWRLNYSERTVTLVTLATISPGTILNPGCHFLLTRSARTQNTGSYTGSVPGDKTFEVNMIDEGTSIIVVRPDNTVVDAVGLTQDSWYEGLPLPSFGSTSTDRSFRRVGEDTDNNHADFVMGSPSTPTNRAGPCSLETR